MHSVTIKHVSCDAMCGLVENWFSAPPDASTLGLRPTLASKPLAGAAEPGGIMAWCCQGPVPVPALQCCDVLHPVAVQEPCLQQPAVGGSHAWAGPTPAPTRQTVPSHLVMLHGEVSQGKVSHNLSRNTKAQAFRQDDLCPTMGPGDHAEAEEGLGPSPAFPGQLSALLVITEKHQDSVTLFIFCSKCFLPFSSCAHIMPRGPAISASTSHSLWFLLPPHPHLIITERLVVERDCALVPSRAAPPGSLSPCRYLSRWGTS